MMIDYSSNGNDQNDNLLERALAREWEYCNSQILVSFRLPQVFKLGNVQNYSI